MERQQARLCKLRMEWAQPSSGQRKGGYALSPSAATAAPRKGGPPASTLGKAAGADNVRNK